jgi:glycosyltransferase involved in cell wall biosynthesis
MLRQATRQARLLITDSEYSKQDLITHFQVPAEKVEVILPAAEHRDCPPESPGLTPDIASQYGITKPYIFYVGKHHPYKNIKTLIRAFNVHSKVYEQYQLVIAGKKERRREDLYQEAHSLRAGSSIVFTDFVPEDELFELYRHARLFVFPSLYEGFGLPPLEAMACGVPVITSNAASLPEVVGDAAIQVEPLDVQGMADAMQAILTNDDLWKNLHLKGLQRAKHFSWDTAAQQLVAIYERFTPCLHESL